MLAWQEDHVNAVASSRCENELFEKFASLAEGLGFEYCAYGLRVPLPVSSPKVMMFSSYPEEWKARYIEQGFLASDPTVRHGMRSLTPIVWSEHVFSSALELWEEARSFGLRFGWAQASRDASGAGGLLTLARSYDELSKSELEEKRFQMAWLAQTVHTTMSERLATKIMPEKGVRLTERETSVLRWTADGKTSAEIAEILFISERTVNFHVNNALVKLGAANKIAATIKAALLGLLS